MGLDVYLYHIPDKKGIDRKQQLFEEEKEKIWKSGGGRNNKDPEITNQLTEAVEAFATNLGLDKWGTSHDKTKIELPSKKYPDHMFKIGYFRSSYNDGGFERVLFNLGLGNMDWIFGVTEDNPGYEFVPNWKEAKKRSKEILRQFKKKPALRCTQVRMNELAIPKVKDSADAMEVFMKELARFKNEKGGFGGSYSNSEGTFYLDEPMKIMALIPGSTPSYFGKGNTSTMNVVYESDNTFYLQALEIIVETCEWVLSQKDPQHYYLNWSG